VTSGAPSPRAFLGESILGPIRGGDADGNAEAEDRRTKEGHRSEAEVVLLADALAVRLILSRMEQAVEQGVGKRLP
jgi:hypothetical protein